MNGSLYKSKKDKMILGVCGGVGEYLGIDSSIVRILWAIASFVYGSGLLLYLIAAFILPYEENGEFEKVNNTDPQKKQDQNKVVAIILILSGLFLLLKNYIPLFDVRYFWPGLLIILGLLLIIKGKEKKNEK